MFVVYLSLVELDKSRHPLEFVRSHLHLLCLLSCIPLTVSLSAGNDIVIFGQPKNLFKQWHDHDSNEY